MSAMPHVAIPQPASNQNGRLRPRPRRDAPKQAAAARPLEKIWSELPSRPRAVDVPSVRMPTIWRPTTTHANAINFRDILRGSFEGLPSGSILQFSAALGEDSEDLNKEFPNGKCPRRDRSHSVALVIGSLAEGVQSTGPPSGLPTGSDPGTARPRRRAGAGQWCPPAPASRNALGRPSAL